jgi:light-regulated signal transduction histidine kinase (bacteriophytochrome)
VKKSLLYCAGFILLTLFILSYLWKFISDSGGSLNFALVAVSLASVALVPPFWFLAKNLNKHERGQEKKLAVLGSQLNEIKKVNQELARSNQALREFSSSAAHDLQEPLRKVSMFGDRLRDSCWDTLDATSRDYLQRMLSANSRMQSLIESQLEYSRIRTQGDPFEAVNLNEVISLVLSDLEMSIEKTGAEIEVKVLPTLAADKVQIYRLLQNLISNALKFYAPEEKPRVVVDAEPDPEMPGFWKIRVCDRGIGIDPINANRIFMPYERLHGRSAYPGSGMGLAICDQIIKRHGGSIGIEKNPGHPGTTFVVRLPEKQFTEGN